MAYRRIVPPAFYELYIIYIIIIKISLRQDHRMHMTVLIYLSYLAYNSVVRCCDAPHKNTIKERYLKKCEVFYKISSVT